MSNGLQIDIAADLHAVRALWTEYWASLGLPATFQNFAAELQSLPGKYSEPRGALALATIDQKRAGPVPWPPLPYPAWEEKRLYVPPAFRGCGVGRALMRWIIQRAKDCGYTTMYGDTLPSMSDALRMYREIGFAPIDRPYSDSPTPGAIYLELNLLPSPTHAP
jgi:putative acetyltransferase